MQLSYNSQKGDKKGDKHGAFSRESTYMLVPSGFRLKLVISFTNSFACDTSWEESMGWAEPVI